MMGLARNQDSNYGFTNYMWNLLLVFFVFPSVAGLGCIRQICDDNDGNVIANADCSKHKDHCGAYHGKRFDNSLYPGVDIKCELAKHVFAPFNGTLSFHSPRGGQKGSRCIDQGLKIQGTDRWTGYTAVISYIKPFKYNGDVKEGDPIGSSIDLTCASSLTGSQTPHILFQLRERGRPVDPTYRLSDCMCTGQICSSNSINEFIGLPFKHLPNYGKGYELRCGNTRENEESPEIVPKIRSPIEASFLGRFRPRNASRDGTFSCDNDGIFLTGAGKWTDFVVHIYNVKFIVEPGIQHVSQGMPVAQRLTCPDQDIKTVFMEFRFHGKLVNVTNLISAKDCRLPQLPQ